MKKTIVMKIYCQLKLSNMYVIFKDFSVLLDFKSSFLHFVNYIYIFIFLEKNVTGQT